MKSDNGDKKATDKSSARKAWDIIRKIRLCHRPFIVLRDENQDDIIPYLCNTIYADIQYDLDFEDQHNYFNDDDYKAYIGYVTDTESINSSSAHLSGRYNLCKFLYQLKKPVLVVQEFYYIDYSYRDAFYTYFSNQHFDMNRYSRRISLFRGAYDVNDFYNDKISNEDYIGSCVINPLMVGSIGRSLISPRYGIMEKDKPVFIRTSTYKTHIYGKAFQVQAFPFRMQDKETSQCVEVTLLNLLDYYSNSYHDYKRIVPSEILNYEQKRSHERVLPAHGISYAVMTSVLRECGFWPRLYSIFAQKSFELSDITADDMLRRCLYHYIESGIPVGVSFSKMNSSDPGHSIVCIGHGLINPALKSRACDISLGKATKDILDDNKQGHNLVSSADFYDEFVVIDDNEPFYHKRKFDSMTLYSEMKITGLAVPLYKRMFLDATNASSIMNMILNDSGDLGISMNCENLLKPGEPVVTRLFMASSVSYKQFRTANSDDISIKQYYSMIPMPRFIWICELYRLDDYMKYASEESKNEKLVFGEIVIDATSAPDRQGTSLIFMRYPGCIRYRSPNQSTMRFDGKIDDINETFFYGYEKNLSFFE